MKDYTITWCAEDIQRFKPEWTQEQAELWLDKNFNRVREVMVEHGWEILSSYAWETIQSGDN